MRGWYPGRLRNREDNLPKVACDTVFYRIWVKQLTFLIHTHRKRKISSDITGIYNCTRIHADKYIYKWSDTVQNAFNAIFSHPIFWAWYYVMNIDLHRLLKLPYGVPWYEDTIMYLMNILFCKLMGFLMFPILLMLQ